ncbi:hypothetical protein C0Q70_18343 [Pomacea canaliculata]|uniref:Glycosyltransferase family 92 protein n=1 Tax=Pomacea canaliculata TaxID=400727 RepID=A0A2T7NMX6_POMCA|nr:hypothetical protein C0Q70_18343 [Pomacea canaliculata]
MLRTRGCHINRRRVGAVVMLAVGFSLTFVVFSKSTFQVRTSARWQISRLERRCCPSEKKTSTVKFFKTVEGQDTFLYSAIVNHEEPVHGEINIIITAFDSTATDDLTCCVVMNNKKLYTTTASVYYKYYIEEYFSSVLEMFKNAPTKAKQYSCVVPQIGFQASHVMLTSSSCPETLEDYLPVIYPRKVPDGLAICAKASFGDKLNPNILMEWFEMQRLLGVDKIQLMDLHNPEPIQKVFRYYTDLGLLDLLPYELPGEPAPPFIYPYPLQASHDETFPILDCRQRLAGYTFVLGHDMDEIAIPARHIDLKTFFKEQLQVYPDAAGFYFWTEFFVYDWGPENNNSDITIFRYLNSTPPRWECKKYVYLPNRVSQARTHAFTPRSPYRTYNLPQEEILLHHYRVCPHVWDTCNTPKITDSSVLRFREILVARLEQARVATGIRPK